MNDAFHELMVELYDARRELFDIDVKTESDIHEKYNVYRSFRRGSECRAVARKVDESDRYIIHRWRKKESADQNKVGHPIDQLYVDVSLVKETVHQGNVSERRTKGSAFNKSLIWVSR